MSYRYKKLSKLVSAMTVAQRGAAARSKFQEGLAFSEIWDMVSSFGVDEPKTDSYILREKEDKIITAIPEIVSCGSDIPVVNGLYEGEKIYFTPTTRSLAIQMCKSKCGEQTFADKFNSAEREAGAGFGQLLQQTFWAGDGINGVGITQAKGAEFRNMSSTPYSSLESMGAVDIANFFSVMFYGMKNPVIYMGAIEAELIGWREQSKEKCNEVWGCVISTLSKRLGESTSKTQARFKYIASFDAVTGLDINNPSDVHTAIMVLDKDDVKMGVSNKVSVSEVITQGHDIAETVREMTVTSPQIYRQGAAQFAFGFTDISKVTSREGGRYGLSGQPKITVPTPLS